MLRALTLALALALGTVFAACSDKGEGVLSTPEELTGAGKGSCPPSIATPIANLFPGALKNAAKQQCQNMQRVSGGNFADAVAKGFNLIGFALGHYSNGKLKDPPGPQTTEQALAELLNAILAFLGLPSDFFDVADLADPNVGFGICDPAVDCVFVNQRGIAGIQVFAGSTSEIKLIKFNLADDSQPFPGFMAYPFIFDFETLGASDAGGGELALAQEGEIFDPPATAGVCFADPPLGPTLEEVPNANRQLAHLIDGETVELLDLRTPTFLSDEDCLEASQTALHRGLPYRVVRAFEPVSEFFVAPLWASPGRLGGALTATSPVGPVDNRGEGEVTTPTTTDLELESSQSCCGFITGATATVVEDTEGQDPVMSGDVEFIIDEVEGTNDQSTVRSLDETGTADLEIVCDGFATGDQVVVPQGSYTVEARFLGTSTHEESGSEPQGFACVVG